RRIAESWANRFGTPLDSVDVIVHSTGGLVVRSYIESDAYGGSFTSPDMPAALDSLPLPTVNNFIMVGVPNRGASVSWNPLHNNWIGDSTLRVVVSSLIDRAYEEVAFNNNTIDGPVPITRDSILDADG